MKQENFTTIVPGEDNQVKRGVKFDGEENIEFDKEEAPSDVAKAEKSEGKVKENNDPVADDQGHNQNPQQNDYQDDKNPRDQQKDTPNKPGNPSSMKNIVAAILCIAAIAIGAATGFLLPGLLIAGAIMYFATKDGLENYNSNKQQSQSSTNDNDDLKQQVRELQKQLDAMSKQEQRSSANQDQDQNSQQQESGANKEENSIQKTLDDLRARIETLERENKEKDEKIQKLEEGFKIKEGGEKDDIVESQQSGDTPENEKVQERNNASDIGSSTLMTVAEELKSSVISASGPDKESEAYAGAGSDSMRRGGDGKGGEGR
jgi:hypothetical protein